MNDGKKNKINTEVLFANKEKDLARAILLLNAGRIVALPTETVYGLAANAFNQAAIKAIFHAKGRPLNNPLIHHVANLKSAKPLVCEEIINSPLWRRIELLAKNFWPGPLTIIVKRSSLVDSFACANLPSVAIRVPRCKSTLKILSQLDFPLVMPSANVSMRPSPTCPAHVLETLNHSIHAVVDGGCCEIGIESTVVSLTGNCVKILRPGAVSRAQIETCLGEKVIEHQLTISSSPISPGQSSLHYSPKVKSIAIKKIDSIAREWQDCLVQIMGRSCDLALLEHLHGKRPAKSKTIAMNNNVKLFGQELYNAYYKAEKYPDLALLIVAPPENNCDWNAINDRISRSCSKT